MSSSHITPSPIYSDDKVVRLIRTYIAITVNACLVVWQEVIILRSLQGDGKEMEQLDPTQITSIPFSLERLSAFVMVPVVIQMLYWLRKTPGRLTWNVLSLIKLTAIIYALMALSGNNMVTNWEQSILSALYIATLLSTTASQSVKTANVLDELPFKDMSDSLCFFRLYSTIMFTIAFQVLTVLDHGKQIQRWPIPVILGGTYGYAFGTVTGLVLNYIRAENNPNKAKV